MANVNAISDVTINFEDISDLITVRLQKMPLLSLFRVGAPRVGEPDRKFQWQEETRSETTATLNANYVAGSGTLTLVSTSAIQAGDRIRIRNHRDTNFVDIVFQVTSVTNATTLAVTVVAGADTNFTNPSPSATIKIIRGIPDNATYGTGSYTEPTLAYSYLQLFQENLQLGEKAIAMYQGGLVPGVNDIIARGLDQKIEKLMWQFYTAVTQGYGRAESTGVGAITRSLPEFINTTSTQNRYNAGGQPLDETMINNLVQQLIEAGGQEGVTRVLRTSLTNARLISQLRSDKVQFVTEGVNQTLGGYVTTYITELNSMGALQIVGDQNCDDNIAYVLNPNAIEIVPALSKTGGMRAQVKETTLGNSHGRSWAILAELGLQVNHPLQDHGVIYDLAN